MAGRFKGYRWHLKSTARDWLLARLDKLDSWKMFEKAFKNTFTAGTSLIIPCVSSLQGSGLLSVVLASMYGMVC